MEVQNDLKIVPPRRRSSSLQLHRTEHKCKIDNVEIVLLTKEHFESSAFSKKSKIAEVLELCFQPKTKKELGNILFNFWERFTDRNVMNEGICEFDGVCMYALDYAYRHDTASFSAISRSLFVYDWQTRLALNGTNKNLIIKCDCFLNELRQFTDFRTYSKSEEMLVNVVLGCILTGNLGLALYLVKFGLVEFPTHINEKCKKMFEILVKGLNNFHNLDENREANTTSVRLDELLNQIKEKEINIRKSILVLCILVVVAEYRMYDKLEEYFPNLKFFTKHKKNLCLRKLKCVDIFIQAATESIITFKDIENFTEVFLNPFITAEIGKSLVEIARKILGDSRNYYNPRSLKDLARFKVRSSLGNSMTMPEGVNKLEIPVALKEFLLFHVEGIWNLLIINHLVLSLQQKINSGPPELEGGNAHELEGGNAHELEGGNAHELEGGNAHELEGRNAHELEGGNERELEGGNVPELEGVNVPGLGD